MFKVYNLLILKRKIEYLLLLPFILIGKMKASGNKLDQEYDLICFFPSYGVGGAELVNADVVAAFPGKRVLVVFCKKTPEEATGHLFKAPHVTIMDVSRYTHRAQSFSNFIYRGMFAHYINRQQKAPVVFNGQCNFGYKILPHLKKEVRTVELIHTSEKKFGWITFPFIPLLDVRIMISRTIRNQNCVYYDEIGIPSQYKERIQIVFYKIKFYLDTNINRQYTGNIKVCYAGRGGYQKRIPLLVSIIRKCQERNLPVEFHLAGNFKDELPEDILSSCNYYGFLSAGQVMNEFLQKMDVLIMTSAFEGFPLIIMESMSNGVIPLVTAVDTIPEHIHTGVNGFLMEHPQDEEGVVSQGVKYLEYICSNRNELKTVSDRCFNYAREHFGHESFVRGYAKAFGFDHDKN